jgi:hypothetical protein
MSVHTKEPWRCSNRNWRDEEHPFHWFVTGGHAEEDGGGEYSVAVAVVVGNETAGDIPRDTARRICAAVNGTAGIPTAALEAGVVAQLRDRLAAAEEARDKLQAFKDWVHAYLDAQGVPHHPPGTHGAEGCRIGDRMDWLMARLTAAEAEVARLRPALEPFARYADHRDKATADRCGDVPLDRFIVCGYAGDRGMAVITIGHCRRARAVLEAPTP